jgi:hypothetical protein
VSYVPQQVIATLQSSEEMNQPDLAPFYGNAKPPVDVLGEPSTSSTILRTNSASTAWFNHSNQPLYEKETDNIRANDHQVPESQ